MLSGALKDVSEGLTQMFRSDFDSRLPREVHQVNPHCPFPSPVTPCSQSPFPPLPLCQDSNAFRERYCYNEETDTVLRKWEASLRTLYTIYAGGDGSIAAGGEVSSAKLLDYPEWQKLCKVEAHTYLLTTSYTSLSIT